MRTAGDGHAAIGISIAAIHSTPIQTMIEAASGMRGRRAAAAWVAVPVWSLGGCGAFENTAA